MSDRYSGLIVTFKEPIKDEDADKIIELFYQIKNVVNVQPVVDDVLMVVAKNQIRHEFTEKLWKVIYD